MRLILLILYAKKCSMTAAFDIDSSDVTATSHPHHLQSYASIAVAYKRLIQYLNGVDTLNIHPLFFILV